MIYSKMQSDENIASYIETIIKKIRKLNYFQKIKQLLVIILIHIC